MAVIWQLSSRDSHCSVCVCACLPQHMCLCDPVSSCVYSCARLSLGLDAEILLQRMREYSGLSCDFVMSQREGERERERERENRYTDRGRERERERESKVQFSPTADLCSAQREAETTRHTHAHSHSHTPFALPVNTHALHTHQLSYTHAQL